jgi:prephenate dehydrogenase
VAAVSHLPLAAAAALTLTASGVPAWPVAAPLAAGGFRDTTRVASGDPRMARAICLTNAGPLVALLDAYIERLQTLRDDIQAGRAGAIEETFRAAKDARDAWQRGTR